MEYKVFTKFCPKSCNSGTVYKLPFQFLLVEINLICIYPVKWFKICYFKHCKTTTCTIAFNIYPVKWSKICYFKHCMTTTCTIALDKLYTIQEYRILNFWLLDDIIWLMLIPPDILLHSVSVLLLNTYNITDTLLSIHTFMS